MRLLVLVLSILSIRAEAQEFCYPVISMQAGVATNICFSPGPFEIGVTKRIVIKQDGVEIDEFEATVVEVDTNNNWSGGNNCKRSDYPTSSMTLVSSQIDYALQWHVQHNCRLRSQGWVLPAN